MKDMPQLGMGTFRLEGDEATSAVTSALKVGFRHVDTAQFYDNEENVGDAIKTSGVYLKGRGLNLGWRTSML